MTRPSFSTSHFSGIARYHLKPNDLPVWSHSCCMIYYLTIFKRQFQFIFFSEGQLITCSYEYMEQSTNVQSFVIFTLFTNYIFPISIAIFFYSQVLFDYGDNWFMPIIIWIRFFINTNFIFSRLWWPWSTTRKHWKNRPKRWVLTAWDLGTR